MSEDTVSEAIAKVRVLIAHVVTDQSHDVQDATAGLETILARHRALTARVVELEAALREIHEGPDEHECDAPHTHKWKAVYLGRVARTILGKGIAS